MATDLGSLAQTSSGPLPRTVRTLAVFSRATPERLREKLAPIVPPALVATMTVGIGQFLLRDERLNAYFDEILIAWVAVSALMFLWAHVVLKAYPRYLECRAQADASVQASSVVEFVRWCWWMYMLGCVGYIGNLMFSLF